MWSLHTKNLALLAVAVVTLVGCSEEPTSPGANYDPRTWPPEVVASVVCPDGSLVEFIRVADDAIVTVQEGKSPNDVALASVREWLEAQSPPSKLYEQLTGRLAPPALLEAEREVEELARSRSQEPDRGQPGSEGAAPPSDDYPGERGPATLAAVSLSCSDTWEWFEDEFCEWAEVCYTCVTGSMSWYTETARMTSTAAAYRGDIILKLDGWKSGSWVNMYSRTVHEGYYVQCTLNSWGCVWPYICEKWMRTRVTDADGDGYHAAVDVL